MTQDRIDIDQAQDATVPILERALAFVKRGWAVYPMYGIKDGKCTCGHEHEAKHNGAHPCGGHTHLSTATDPVTIMSWAEKWPNANFAVATGRKQNGFDTVLIVVEMSADGAQYDNAIAKVIEVVGNDFEVCGQVETPDGMRQIYVEVKSEQNIAFGKFSNFKIHGDGSTVMVPGALHHSGKTYQWGKKPQQAVPATCGSVHAGALPELTATANPAAVSAITERLDEPKPSTSNATAAKASGAKKVAEAVLKRMAENRAIAAEYFSAGFKLCRVATGSKGPNYKGWQDKPITMDQVNHEGVGLIHAHSGTCAIDVDNYESAVAWFEARDIDLCALMQADDAVQIQSGRANRGKLLYRLPPGITPLTTVQIKHNDGSMLIEFRCAPADGKGCQDVLPPTIHPATGKPYEWGGAGDFKDVPELPVGVLALWQSELATKSAKEPLAAPAAPRAAGIVVEGGRNNALFKLGGELARAGCATDSIVAALLIENQKRCQPPLPATEVQSIAKSAATNSYGAKEAAARLTEVTESDEVTLGLAVKAVEESDKNKQKSECKAVEVEQLPAVMRDIIEWNARTSRTVQPAFALCTALAACSSALARDFFGAGGSYTNLYIVAIGPTASGKENVLGTVSQIIDECEQSRRAGKPSSDAGVLTVMARNPASVFLIDELGEVLQSVFDPKAASYQARIGTVLMELYTKGGKSYRGTEYANQEAKSGGRPRGDIFSPCPSLIGATTATTLYKGLTHDAIHSGFMPRMLVFRAPDQIPMPNVRCEQAAMPESIKTWLKAIKDRKDRHTKVIQQQGDLIGFKTGQHAPISLPFTRDAQVLYEQAMISVVGRRNAGLDELESNMLSRLVENASRVALTLALATDPWADEVSAENFKLALTIVTHATEAFMGDIRGHLFDSKHAKIEALAYEQIVKFFKANDRAISEGILVDRCKTYSAATPKEREQAIKALAAQGKITMRPGRNTGSVVYLPRG